MRWHRWKQKINQTALAVHIDDPETLYIKKETKREIRWALSKTRADMTEKQTEAFRLYYDEDMILEEIDRTLGISAPAVLYRLDGVSKKLNKNMEQFFIDHSIFASVLNVNNRGEKIIFQTILNSCQLQE